jgi:hypothetical protein
MWLSHCFIHGKLTLLKFSILKFQTDINTLCPCRNKGLMYSAQTEPKWLIKQEPRFGVSLCVYHFVFISTVLLLLLSATIQTSYGIILFNCL